MYCPKCGQQLPDGAAFCGRCGHRLQNVPVPPPNPPKPKVPVRALAIGGGVIAAFALCFAVVRFVIAPLLGGGGIAVPSLFGTGDDYGTTISNVVNGANSVMDGNRLYFINTAVTGSDMGSPAAILSVKTDGSDQRLVYETKTSLDGASLANLYLVNGRLYFYEQQWSFSHDAGDTVSAIKSVKLDGSDDQVVWDLKGEYTRFQIANGRIFYTRDSSLYSMALDGSGRKRVCDTDSYSWAVADGYVYVNDSESSNYVIRRYPIEEGEAESLYQKFSANIGSVTPYNDRLFFTERIEPGSSSNTASQLVSVDIESGDKDILFKEASNKDGQKITRWGVSPDGVFVVTTRTDKATTFYRIPYDGSTEEEIFTYDGEWAGNPLRLRNLASQDDVYLTSFSIHDGRIYFAPCSSEAMSEIASDNTEEAMYTPMCSIAIDGTDFLPLALMSSTDAEPVAVES